MLGDKTVVGWDKFPKGGMMGGTCTENEAQIMSWSTEECEIRTHTLPCWMCNQLESV